MNQILKFLVDVGVGKSIEEYLITHEYDVKAVSQINSRMTDQEIIQIASQEENNNHNG